MVSVSVDGSDGVQNSSVFARISFVWSRGTAVGWPEADPNDAPQERVVLVESKAVLVGACVVVGAGGCDVVVGTGTAEGWIIRLPAGAVA